MYKSALGALALSLSFGLAAGPAGAQKQQSTASSASQPASSATDGIQTYGAQTASTQMPSNSGNPYPTASLPTASAMGKGKTNTTAGDAAVPQAKSKKRAPDEMIPVQASRPMVSTKLGWQNFEDYISLKQGQDQIALTMTVTNAGYQSLVLNLNGSKLATEKDFKSTTLAMQMAGALAVGDNKFVIQAYGKPGSKISWTLQTPRAIITDIQPTTKGSPDKVTITGRNFAKTIAGDQVQVGSKWATVLSGDSHKINATLPTGLSGKQKVVVLAGGFASKPFEYELKAAPVVTGVDMVSAPPGQALTIMGTGFSPVAKENIATIGGVPATITKGTTTQLNVVVPEMYFPQWNVPIVVKIGTVESNKNIMMNIQSRVIPNDGAGEL